MIKQFITLTTHYKYKLNISNVFFLNFILRESVMVEIYRYFYKLLFRGWMFIYDLPIFEYLLCDRHIT